MHTVTIRMEDESVAELDEEYEERGFRNRTDYIRHIVGNRDAVFADEAAEAEVTEQLADHDEQLTDHTERLANHEKRLSNLEAGPRPLGRSQDS